MIPILLSVSFLTLLERKILGYSQSRKGPNIVGLYGLLQPISDGIKLFSKELIIPSHSNVILYYIAPIISLIFSLHIWIFIPFSNNSIIFYSEINIICILAISSINIYSIIASGWGSNSNYAFLGCMRATAQMISYEISITLIISTIIITNGSFNLIKINNFQIYLWYFFTSISLFYYVLCFLFSWN